jgi:hypothetical protein
MKHDMDRGRPSDISSWLAFSQSSSPMLLARAGAAGGDVGREGRDVRTADKVRPAGFDHAGTDLF